MELCEELVPLVKSRAGSKGWVTRHLGHLTTLLSQNNLNFNVFKRLEKSVNHYIQSIENKDIEISATYDKHLVDFADKSRKANSDATAAFILDAHQKLAALETGIAPGVASAAGNAGGTNAPVTSQELLKAVSQMGSNPIKVLLDCGVFNGDEKDKFEFQNWLNQFETLLKTRSWSEEFKKSFLKTKIQGNAAAFIAHLGPVTVNYRPCIDALMAQYLDELFLIDEYVSGVK